MSEKEQLLEYIRVTQQNVTDMTELTRNEKEFFENEAKYQIHLKKKWLRLVGVIFVLVFMWNVVIPNINDRDMNNIFTILLLLFPILFLGMQNFKKKRFQKKHTKLLTEHTELADKLLYWLPPQNRELTYFLKIQELARYGRANSLGEALNIISNEENNEQLIHVINNMTNRN